MRRILRSWHRNAILVRSLNQFRSSPTAERTSGALLADLSYGWGNEGFAGRDAFLRTAVELACKVDGTILECGSGLSTLLVASCLRPGARLISIEHDGQWCERVTRQLRRFSLRGQVLFSPLKDYGEFHWYEEPPDELTRGGVSLVLCDGPPGTTRGGRYGLVPVMRSRLGSGSVILLDDADREEEHRIATRWAHELDASLQVIDGQVAMLRVPL